MSEGLVEVKCGKCGKVCNVSEENTRWIEVTGCEECSEASREEREAMCASSDYLDCSTCGGVYHMDTDEPANIMFFMGRCSACEEVIMERYIRDGVRTPTGYKCSVCGVEYDEDKCGAVTIHASGKCGKCNRKAEQGKED